MYAGRWFSLFSSTTAPKYQHLDLAPDINEHEINKWKQRFLALSFAYILTVGGGLFVFLFQPGGVCPTGETLRTDTIFGIRFIRERVVFTPEQTYNDVVQTFGAPASKNQTVWDSLQPRGGGFIRVPNPDTYDLAGGLPLKDNGDGSYEEGYGISMFHQIHCLVAIRSAFQTSVVKDRHIDHCFDYLRQSIMCTGDTTLEKVTVDERGTPQPDIDGWGVVHECRNWNMLFEFAEKQRVEVIDD